MDEKPKTEEKIFGIVVPDEGPEWERLDFFVVFSSEFEINIYSSKNLQLLYQSSSFGSGSIDIHQNPK